MPGEDKKECRVCPIRLLFRTKTSVELHTLGRRACAADAGADDGSGSTFVLPLKTILVDGPTSFRSVFAPDGSFVLLHRPGIGVVKRNLQDDDDGDGDDKDKDKDQSGIEKPFFGGTARVQFVSISPRGTYAVTWERPPAKTSGHGKSVNEDENKNDDANHNDNNNTNDNHNDNNNTNDNDDDECQNNLKVWSTCTGQYLHGFRHRTVKKDDFPPLRWTHDERFAFYLATSNDLRVYPGRCFGDGTGRADGVAAGSSRAAAAVRFVDRVACPGLTSFSLPKHAVVDDHDDDPAVNRGGAAAEEKTATPLPRSYLLTTFVPESKGKPARISLYRYTPQSSSSSSSSSAVVLASKSFYRAEECRVRWSPRGDSALVVTSSAVDSSGQSYYGSADLYLLLGTTTHANSAATKNPKALETGQALSVQLPTTLTDSSSSSSNSISDARWNPDPTKPPSFVVISGKMPSSSTLHHGMTGDAIAHFGNAHRNTALWSPHGRFLILGGFGNLAGGMDFWDVNKKKTMPQSYHPETGKDTGVRGATAHCAVGYGWSPDGRTFVVSTTSPRMNVDNGVRLYKYNGLEVTDDASLVGWKADEYRPDRLLEATFVPAPRGVFPDRPQTPPRKRQASGVTGGASAMAATTTTTTATLTKPGDNGATTTTTAAKPVPAPAPYVPPMGRYMPPAARRAAASTGGGGGGIGTSLAERMRKERGASTLSTTTTGIAATLNPLRSKKGVPVGMTAPSPRNTCSTTTTGTATATATATDAKSKSALKREKAKLAKERALKAAQQEEEHKKQQQQQQQEEEMEKERLRQLANLSDPDKRRKKIRKALKRIEELKEKDPSTLDDDQKDKISKECELRKELEGLGL